ncbi:hypothetical protein BDV12DRAFT_164585 [Aspergillus spectabilis]
MTFNSFQGFWNFQSGGVMENKCFPVFWYISFLVCFLFLMCLVCPFPLGFLSSHLHSEALFSEFPDLEFPVSWSQLHLAFGFFFRDLFFSLFVRRALPCFYSSGLYRVLFLTSHSLLSVPLSHRGPQTRKRHKSSEELFARNDRCHVAFRQLACQVNGHGHSQPQRRTPLVLTVSATESNQVSVHGSRSNRDNTTPR